MILQACKSPTVVPDFDRKRKMGYDARKTILMKGLGETSSYTSTDPDQEGLTFNGSEAIYDISKSNC